MRIKGGVVTKRRHKKILATTKGYWMSRHLLIKTAHAAMMHAGKYSYNDRKQRESQLRNLWITRITAAAELNGIAYSRLMDKFKKAGIELNRKILADLAFNKPTVFAGLVKSV